MPRTSTVICLRWISSGSIEHFTNLGKMYRKYDAKKLGVSRFTLNKKELYGGYQNDIVEIVKSFIQ